AEHDGRARPLKILEIAPGGKKRQVVGTGPVQGRDARHGHVRRAHQLTVREGRDVARAQAGGGTGAGCAVPAALRLLPVAHGLGAPYLDCFSRSITLLVTSRLGSTARNTLLF